MYSRTHSAAESIINDAASDLDADGDGVVTADEIAAADERAADDALNQAQVMAAEHLADLQRLQAEYVNYRKRVDRDRAMASELGPHGITVNAISPGLTRSPGTLARKPRPGMADMEAEFNFAATMQAIKRVEVPEDLAGTVSYLTSDDAAFITGQTLNVDGGRVRS